jgi:hypothetical protein
MGGPACGAGQWMWVRSRNAGPASGVRDGQPNRCRRRLVTGQGTGDDSRQQLRGQRQPTEVIVVLVAGLQRKESVAAGAWRAAGVTGARPGYGRRPVRSGSQQFWPFHASRPSSAATAAMTSPAMGSAAGPGTRRRPLLGSCRQSTDGLSRCRGRERRSQFPLASAPRDEREVARIRRIRFGVNRRVNNLAFIGRPGARQAAERLHPGDPLLAACAGGLLHERVTVSVRPPWWRLAS